MIKYRAQFEEFIGAKNSMNDHEQQLFSRAQYYTKRLTWIPGIRMIAVVNSLSMYATHEDSDIDLFIVAENGTLWWVRFWTTITLLLSGVWRHGEDIRENFCLSFFVTIDGQNMQKIALKNDIYLFYWVFFLKPLWTSKGAYEAFLTENTWVDIDGPQREENTQFVQSMKRSGIVGTYLARAGNFIIRLMTRWKTKKRYNELGKPEGVVISDTVLKFHDTDRRRAIRDAIFGKNFDK